MTGSGVSVLVTTRSADASTTVVWVAELLAAFGSVVVVVTVAVLLSVEPLAALGLTWTTRVKVALAPAAKLAAVAVKVPVPPTGGVVRLNAGPLVCIADTNVVLAGIRSLSVALAAALGPALLTVMV